MSAPETRAVREPQAYGTIVIVGGGCYGSYYVRQLRRAAEAGAVRYERLCVVDRDAACTVASDFTAAPEAHEALVVAEWEEFFGRYLAHAGREPKAAAQDAIVPSPLMPHLTARWLLARASARWPGRDVRLEPLERAPTVPWERAGADAVHYVSFADWMCPINCVEPARCPHTRTARDWSLPIALERYVADERARDRPLSGPLVFHCAHRVYGVGMFDTRVLIDADNQVAVVAAEGAAEFLIGSVSHCHGALARLVVGA